MKYEQRGGLTKPVKGLCRNDRRGGKSLDLSAAAHAGTWEDSMGIFAGGRLSTYGKAVQERREVRRLKGPLSGPDSLSWKHALVSRRC